MPLQVLREQSHIEIRARPLTGKISEPLLDPFQPETLSGQFVKKRIDLSPQKLVPDH